MSQIKVELQETMGSDRAIAHAAWTSSTLEELKELKTEEDVKRVVNMLADAKHSVPFESVIFRFWMRIPIATDRQLMTHRVASHSGLSGRYRTMPDEFLLIPGDVESILTKAACDSIYVDYNETCSVANEYYRQGLEKLKLVKEKDKISSYEYKRAREFLRGMLPQHNMTERVSIFNLRSFANFYKLRSKPDAQPEIQQVARLMLEKVKEANICPIALDALERNSWVI